MHVCVVPLFGRDFLTYHPLIVWSLLILKVLNCLRRSSNSVYLILIARLAYFLTCWIDIKSLLSAPGFTKGQRSASKPPTFGKAGA